MKFQLLTAGIASLTLSVTAQFSITHSSVRGLSCTSTGGGYSLNGSIGLPVAGKSAVGSFSVESGSIALIAVIPNPTGPMLSLSLAQPNTVLLRWPYPSAGFQVEQATAAVGEPWTRVADEPMQVGSEWQMTLQLPIGNRFYRLKSP